MDVFESVVNVFEIILDVFESVVDVQPEPSANSVEVERPPEGLMLLAGYWEITSGK